MNSSIIGRVSGCAAMLALTAAANGFVVIYVDDSTVANGPGTSFNNAYRHLQNALTFAAVPANNVTEIRIGQGTYRPDRTTASPAGTGA